MVKYPKVSKYNETDCKYLLLLEAEKYDFIYNYIRYVTGVQSDITYVISHNYAKINVGSYDSLPLEKILTFQNVVISIKSIFNKDKNNYSYNTFLNFSYK